MVKDKRQRKAEKGAKRAAKFADELRYKLDRYRLDERSSSLIDRVLESVDALQRYHQELADQPATKVSSPDKAQTD